MNQGDLATAQARWVIAWLIMFGLLTLIYQTRPGKVVIYYSGVLMVLLILLTQYRFIADSFGRLTPNIPTADTARP